jgi:acetyl esterase/lipase
MMLPTVALAWLILSSLGMPADDPPEVLLWPGGAPGSESITAGNVVVDRGKDGARNRSVTLVHKPSLTVYLPPKEKATGAAVVICPGGGHRMLAIEHEGHDIAKWYNKIGVAGFVLQYRLARTTGSKYTIETHALDDAKRAVRLVRSRASEWSIDPTKVGMIGFSAGGEVAALAGTRFDLASEGAADPIDRLSTRPDFLVLVYPGIRPETLTVTKETPPTFLVVADDDRGSAQRTAAFYLALKKAGVSGELHVYAKGGHGFGMRDNHLPVSTWPKRLEEWMLDRGWTRRP